MHDAFAGLRSRRDLPELAHLATKVELEIWGGALLVRIESRERRRLETLLDRMERSDQRLPAEHARHTRASSEEMSTRISTFDEKYAALPPRVSRLEAKVFAPERR